MIAVRTVAHRAGRGLKYNLEETSVLGPPMDVLGSITRVDSRTRPPLLAAAAAGLAISLATLAAVRTNFLFPPTNAPESITLRLSAYLYKNRVFPDSPSALAAFTADTRHAAPAPITLKGLPIACARIEAGYTRTPTGGPAPLANWAGREELWSNISEPDPTPDEPRWPAPTDAQSRLLQSHALHALLADPRLARRTLGVSLGAPLRTWANPRGIASDLGALAAWTLGPFTAWLAWAELSARARPRRIRAGLCPECSYSLAGADFPRCPECGHALSLHDRSVLAAMTPNAGTPRVA